MGWLKKNPDPISAHARALNEQISALESQIKQLDSQLHAPAGPRLRSSTLPPDAARVRTTAPVPAPLVREPVFAEIKQQPIQPAEPPEQPEHFNEFGVRKFDLPALWNRWCNHWRGPTTTNPRLVSYLAAGGVQGLRPMRYEKRVARNRFIGLAALLFVILFLMLCHYYRNH